MPPKLYRVILLNYSSSLFFRFNIVNAARAASPPTETVPITPVTGLFALPSDGLVLSGLLELSGFELSGVLLSGVELSGSLESSAGRASVST